MILEEGTHQQLMNKNGLYKKLYSLQANVFAGNKTGDRENDFDID